MWAHQSTLVPSSLPRHADHIHQGFVAEIRQLCSFSLNTRRASSHLFAEPPPSFTGCLFKDAQEKCLEANLVLSGPKGQKANWAGAARDTAWVCVQGHSDKTQRDVPTELVHSREGKGREGKGREGKGREDRSPLPRFLGWQCSARSISAFQSSLSAAQHHFRSKSSLICASHCIGFLPKQQSAFLDERVP